MSSSIVAPPKKTERYHHGDLKKALLEAALDLAIEVGVDNFTLREVARRAGVSPAAPYHHFADKNDLVRELALQAFGKLTRALQEARATRDNALQQLEQIGVAYVCFAFTHHAEFRFMFRRELCAPVGQIDPLELAGLNAQAVLLETVQAAQKDNLLCHDESQSLVLSLWSLVHGLAMILLETPIIKTATLQDAEHLARRGTVHILAGIAAAVNRA